MTIRIKKDRIEFTANGGSTFTLAESNTGFTFDGTISAGDILSAGFQGSVSGYSAGGYVGPAASNVIDKFSFSANSNATDVGDLTAAGQSGAGQSSPTNGYASGFGNTNTINKYSFFTDGNATDVGDLTEIRQPGGGGQSSFISGYTSGGSPGSKNTIDKFSFATDNNATDVGDLTQPRFDTASQSSTTDGYTSGGYSTIPGNAIVNTIDKFPFSTDTNATDVGDLSVSRWRPTGQSSSTFGYTSGGRPATNTIDKFPFSANSNATDVGDLSQTRSDGAGQSSTVSGYTSGGEIPGSPTPVRANTIDKFPFSSDANATDVGDLTQARIMAAGAQH